MITKPTGWDNVWRVSHKFEWRYIIDDVEYTGENIRESGVINRPLMDRPCIGRCCTGDLTLTVYDKASHSIPKAATVVAQCRMVSADKSLSTSWVDQGHYWVSKRSRNSGKTTLTCRDAMIFAGRTYLDKTSFTEWPASMSAVVNEIAGIMGVSVDSRSTIMSGSIYRVSYPNEDVLMSEILSNIAAAHGGNFIMTAENKLRLVQFPGSNATVQADIGGAYSGYTPYSTGEQEVKRVTMTDDADNQFTTGADGGVELDVECIYATQAMVNGFNSWLIGRKFYPYTMSGARIDPLIELGDVFTASYKGDTYKLLANTMTQYCTAFFTADISNYMDENDEEEVPYVSMEELRSNRYISTTKSYRGNRINRTEGFVSEYVVDEEPVARMIANSDKIAMQRVNDGGQWEDVLFFDTEKRTYKFNGEVKINAEDKGNKTFYQNDAPTSGMEDGDLWIDADNNYKLYRYNGSSWVSTKINEDDAGNRTFYQNDAPSSGMKVGDLWIDSDDNYKLYRYNGSSWVSTKINENDAGNKTFYQDDAPASGMKDGDLWVDTNDNYKLYRYNSNNWVSIQDLNIPDLIGQLTAANSSLNILSTGIDAKVDATYLMDQLSGLVQTFNSALSLKANELTLSFTGSTRDAIDEVNTSFGSLIRASGNGVEVGKSGSNFRVVITNTEMAFYDGTTKLAYMNNNKMFITSAQVTNSLEIGQDGGNTFSWVKTQNGLSLSYVSAN